MLSRKKQNIRMLLISLVLFWFFTVSLIAGSNLAIQQESIRQILQSVEDLVEEANTKVVREIEERIHVLNVTSKYITVDELKRIEKQEKLEALEERLNEVIEKNKFKRIGISLLDGTTYLNNGERINVKDREYFQQTLNGNEYVSYLMKSKLDGKEVNVYSVPVIKQGEIVAVLWASVYTEQFYNTLDLNFLSGDAQTFFIDDDGQLIISAFAIHNNFYEFIQEYGDSNRNKKSLKLMQEDIKNKKSGYQKFGYDAQELYIYYTKVQYSDWWMLTTVPEYIIKEKSERLTKSIGIRNLMLIVIANVGFYFIYKKGKKLNEQLQVIAYTDDITKGKNDIYLKEYLKQCINQKKKYQFAFISLEIINIKSMINALGIKNVYFILSDTYESISRLLINQEVIVHSYLGEYKLLLEYNNMEQLKQRIDSIFNCTQNKKVELKMGIYLIKDCDVDFEDICAYTNIAKMNIVEGERFAFYSKRMHQEELKKIKLEDDIRNGITNKEFKAWFQPKYGADGKTIIGAEALVRWYKYGTIISPYVFIPVCETCGLIKEIDELVLEDVCQNLRKWMKEKKEVIPISVNLSRNYLDKENLIERLESIINAYCIPKKLIQFEVTESCLVENEKKLKEIIDILHNKGFEVLLDDFGVGYSSIKTIADMKFDVLKIDKSFIDGIGEKRWEDIIEYTLSLSERLKMRVIAEGIETKEQYEFLLNCNCQAFQGYYFNKPMDANEFSKLL